MSVTTSPNFPSPPTHTYTGVLNILRISFWLAWYFEVRTMLELYDWTSTTPVVALTSLFVRFLPDLVPAAILIFIWFPSAECCRGRGDDGGNVPALTTATVTVDREASTRPPSSALYRTNYSFYSSGDSSTNNVCSKGSSIAKSSGRPACAALGRIELPMSIGADSSWRQKRALSSSRVCRGDGRERERERTEKRSSPFCIAKKRRRSPPPPLPHPPKGPSTTASATHSQPRRTSYQAAERI